MVKSPVIWGIAGPSGCGKSTLAGAFENHFGNQLTVLHLDNYSHTKENVQWLEGFPNWDHPTALRWDDYLADITAHTATPILLLEGYLLLHDARIRSLLSKSIFLNLPAHVRNARRDKLLTPKYQSYNQKVLEPMTQQHLMPTLAHAGMVLEVGDLTREEVFRQALQYFEAAEKAQAA